MSIETHPPGDWSQEDFETEVPLVRKADFDRAVAIMRALCTQEHLDLGDLVYVVRDREGQGWEGPAVKAWSEAMIAAFAFLTEVSE
jgi:hypothetical protein